MKDSTSENQKSSRNQREGFFKLPRQISRQILDKRDPEYIAVAVYISERAWFSFKDSDDGLKRGQLRTSIREIARERRIRQTKVFRIMKFLREIGFVTCQDEMTTGGRKTGQVITLPFYDVGKKANGTQIPGENEKKRNASGTQVGTQVGTQIPRGKDSKSGTQVGTQVGTPNKENKGKKKGFNGKRMTAPPTKPPKFSKEIESLYDELRGAWESSIDKESARWTPQTVKKNLSILVEEMQVSKQDLCKTFNGYVDFRKHQKHNKNMEPDFPKHPANFFKPEDWEDTKARFAEFEYKPRL